MSLMVLRYKRFHISYLIGWLMFGVLIGISFGRVWPVVAAWPWLVPALILLPLAVWQRRWWSFGLILVAGLVIGWQRGSSEQVALNVYQNYMNQTVHVRGVISNDPQPNQQGMKECSLGSVVVNDRHLDGEISLSTTSKLDIKRGDVVEVSGKMKPGFGTYQAAIRYATLNGVNSGATAIRDLRDHFSTGVRETVQEPEASLGLGFVVGQRSALPPKLDDQLKAVGLTHIVVASGYNLTILVRFARRLVAKRSRFMALSIGVSLVVGFIAFSGLTPSMVRAGAVTLLSLLAWYYGRRFHPLVLIALVAAGTAYWNPIYLWGDMGWYLSFLAFIGVLIVAPLMTARIYKAKKPGAIGQLLIETVAAQLVTLPLILFTFERLPLLSLIANIAVTWIIPFAMIATTLAGIAGMIAPVALGWLGLPATILIGYAVWVVEALSSVEWAQVNIAIPLSALVAAYVALVGLLFVWWRKTGHRFLARSIVE